jgi:transcriptional regulator with XRE-family HTH domain
MPGLGGQHHRNIQLLEDVRKHEITLRKTRKKTLDEFGLKNKDFIGKVGSKSYVSMILNGKKPLTLDLARIFHKELNIPAEIHFPRSKYFMGKSTGC